MRPSFYLVTRATQGSSHLQGKGSTFISQSVIYWTGPRNQTHIHFFRAIFTLTVKDACSAYLHCWNTDSITLWSAKRVWTNVTFYTARNTTSSLKICKEKTRKRSPDLVISTTCILLGVETWAEKMNTAKQQVKKELNSATRKLLHQRKITWME